MAGGKFLKEVTRCHRLVGKLIYPTITRPELTYAVHILSQFMQAPKEECMEATRRVLRYLKGCAGEGIFLKDNNNLQLFVFVILIGEHVRFLGGH